MNLANASTKIMIDAKRNGIFEKGIASVVIPRYAKTNASARYPTVSNAKCVPYQAYYERFGNVYIDYSNPHTNSDNIPK